MKIIGARLKGQTDTITLPRMASVKSENFTKSKIISLIDKNQEDEFIFIIQDDQGGKWVRPFGPESLDTTIPVHIYVDEEGIPFADGTFRVVETPIKGMKLPIIHPSHIAKLNEDGTITVSTEEIPSNEGALPRQSTVDQLNRIRKATKSTTIDDTIPKMKGANLGYEGNTVDRGIESYEEFQKKNKSFVPGWNLKHLKSPFKTTLK